jgi:flavin-dependent dehydrogenase
MVVSRQYFAGLPDPGKVGLPGRNYLHLWYAGELPRLGVGYGRIFYLSDGSANVGIALYGRNLPKKPDARLAALCRLHKGFLAGPEVSGMLDGAAPEEEMQRRVFRAGGAGVRARHAQGLLEAGDAGGASHPTSGEGIGFALAAGRLAAGWAQEAHRRRDFSTGLLSGYTRQLRSLHSVEQTSTHALVALVNRLAALEPMEPVLARCPTDARLRRTVVEALIGNTAAATLLRCHPATSARTAATTLRKLARAARTWK